MPTHLGATFGTPSIVASGHLEEDRAGRYFVTGQESLEGRLGVIEPTADYSGEFRAFRARLRDRIGAPLPTWIGEPGQPLDDTPRLFCYSIEEMKRSD